MKIKYLTQSLGTHTQLFASVAYKLHGGITQELVYLSK